MSYIRFIDRLSQERVVRKAVSGLWTKMSQFHDIIEINIIHRRVKKSYTNKHIKQWKRPWGHKHIEIPCKMFLFYKMYNRKSKKKD